MHFHLLYAILDTYGRLQSAAKDNRSTFPKEVSRQYKCSHAPLFKLSKFTPVEVRKVTQRKSHLLRLSITCGL